MAMSRKHYNALAALVREVPGQGCGPEWLAARLADICGDDNPRFSRARFLGACEPIPAREDVEWIHDAQRDGAGCGWCGSFAQVNGDNECRDCHAA